MRGKRVAIFEARLGRELAELIGRHGGTPLHAPALAELPDLDAAAIAGLVASLAARPPKLAVFQTGVGTQALFKATDALGATAQFLQWLQQATVVARGPKPAGPLRARGVRIDRSAADPYTTAKVLEAIGDMDLHSARVVVQRYGVANAELDRALQARGAEVVEIPTYRWSLPPDTQPLIELVGSLERGEVDAAVFTNAEQARNLFAIGRRIGKEEPLRQALNRTLVASIGPIASAALRAAQVRVGIEASPPKLGALVKALEAALS